MRPQMVSPGATEEPDASAGRAAVLTRGLGKRYGSNWALRDCSVVVPQGRISALVGPNGSGKTTLLKMLSGLSRPSTGESLVLGRSPGQDRRFLTTIGYLAQDMPLYRQLSGEEHLRLGANLNQTWDAVGATERMRALGVPMDRPIKTLSGGQRAQVALAMALGKQPRLLLMDEPVAALDPLARRQFLSSLAGAVAETGLTVLLSSHLVHDLERVCDHVIVLNQSRVLLCQDIDTVLSQHRLLTRPRQGAHGAPAGAEVIKATLTERQYRVVARLGQAVCDPAWEMVELPLEDIVLAYMEYGLEPGIQGTTDLLALRGGE